MVSECRHPNVRGLRKVIVSQKVTPRDIGQFRLSPILYTLAYFRSPHSFTNSCVLPGMSRYPYIPLLHSILIYTRLPTRVCSQSAPSPLGLASYLFAVK